MFHDILRGATDGRLLRQSRRALRRGLFLGDYEGLASDGLDFLPAFALPHDSGPVVDPASIFFRRFGPS